MRFSIYSVINSFYNFLISLKDSEQDLEQENIRLLNKIDLMEDYLGEINAKIDHLHFLNCGYKRLIRKNKSGYEQMATDNSLSFRQEKYDK